MSETYPIFDPLIANGSAESHRPGKDRYLSANAFEALPYIYGPKGEFLVGFYTYVRWLDDLVDSPSLPLDQRKKLLERQRSLLSGESLDGPLLPIEEYFSHLPFDRAVAEQKPEILEQFHILIDTMQEDLDHAGLWPRTMEEIRSYGARVLMPYAQVVSLALNGKPIGATSAFEQFLADWSSVGSLLHFRDDLEEGVVKVGFSENEAQSIRECADEDGRRQKILEIFHSGRYREEWKSALSRFRRGIQSFFALDIPYYQKLVAYSYLSAREPLRLPRLFERVEVGLSQT